MLDIIDELQRELEPLLEKTGRLDAFMCARGGVYDSLPGKHRAELFRQITAMRDYALALRARIRILSNPN
jgi:hypothetical protein